MDKANILTIVLVGSNKAVLFGDGAHLGLGKLTQRELHMGQLVLRHAVEHIALVLIGVDGLEQKVAALGLVILNASVVTGDHIITAQLLGLVEKLAKF